MFLETTAPPAGWAASLKALLFGYDFFISYAQEEATRVYGNQLRALLSERDYTVFLDTTELRAGDNLTLRIRWSLRRTRCLIVLGTERALASKWVKREIELYAARKRRIVPLDLEQIRARHPWPQIGESLFETDSLPDPSPAAMDKIIASLQGWKANKLARLSLAASALGALAVAVSLTGLSLNIRDKAMRMRTQAVVSIAQSLPDPLARSLVLSEADVDRLPNDAVAVARQIARSAVPETVLRASSVGISALAASLDNRWVFAADDSNVVRRWPITGASDPTVICKLDWRAARMESLPSALFCCNDSHAALVSTGHTGEPIWFEKPEGASAIEADARTAPTLPCWRTAEPSTAWRVSHDGHLVAFRADQSGVVGFVQIGDGTWKKVSCPVPGHSVLDVYIRDQAPDYSFTGLLLCSDGSLASFEIDSMERFKITAWLGDLVTNGECLLLPENVRDARSFYANGSIVVVGLGADDGIVVASQTNHWTARVFRPSRRGKLKDWTVAETGNAAFLRWDDGGTSYLRLSDFREAPQPPSTRIRILTQSDYAMGVEGENADEGAGDPPEMANATESPDGHLVLLPTLRNAWLWSVGAGHPSEVLRAGLFFDDEVRPVFTPDGQRVITPDTSGEMRVWRIDGNQLDPQIVGLHGQVVKLAYREGGSLLVATGNGGVFLIDPKTLHANRLYQRDGQMARCALSPSGQRGAAIYSDGLVALFLLTNRTLVASVQCPKQDPGKATYEDVEFMGESRVIAFNGVLPSLIDFDTHRIHSQSRTEWNAVYTADNPAAGLMLVETVSGVPELVRTTDLDVIRPLKLSRNQKVWSSALSPSGTLIALGLDNGQILVFQSNSTNPPINIQVDGAQSSIDSVDIDRFDKRIAFGTYSGKAGVVELRKPSVPQWFQAPNLGQATGVQSNNFAHFGVVMDVHFSPNGQQIVTCSGLDGFTRVWRTDGTCLEALHTAGAATFARLLEDGRLVNVTEQGEVSFWRIGIRSLLEHLHQRSNATLSPSERIRYLNEDADDAYRRYSEQERGYGRTPLPRNFTKPDYR
ncbi:MAG TPA: toll/interleukin-1 receptor domain-containing protein [Verrucomicrobiae bacterium]|nr:toll/interleukin-1 receptor domain-containing protein [Verrucomicrobiae bacterium]